MLFGYRFLGFMRLSFFLLIHIFFLFGGCKEGGSGNITVSLQDQNTPQKLLVKFYSSKADDKKAQFLECFTASKTQQTLGGIMFEHWQLIHKFKDRLLEMYGPDAWENYQKAYTGKDFEMTLSLTPEKNIEQFVANIKLNIVEDGNKIWFRESAVSPKDNLVKENKYWYYYNHFPEQSIKFGKLTNKAIKSTIDMIGEPDVNVTDLKSIMTDKVSKSANLPVD
ncbi:MAG: hypothetical protein ACYSSI_05535 [Planctomycetota bacterium]|jgi:hypothetical protein